MENHTEAIQTVAVLSDIHGNIQALQAVIEDAAAHAVKEYWLLGDIVDYGANSNEVIAALRKLPVARRIAGNHDAALFLDGIPASRTPHGAQAFAYTERHLAEESREWLEGFAREASLLSDGYWLVHGEPENPYWGYFKPQEHDDARPLFAAMQESGAHTLLLGHTHTPLYLSLGGMRIANPGSVGQPRNGDTRAQYLLLSESGLQFRGVAYDVQGAARAIEAAGLPAYLSERLYVGK